VPQHRLKDPAHLEVENMEAHSENDDWISSADALRMVTARTGDSSIAQTFLDKEAKKGNFSARAGAMVQEYECGNIGIKVPRISAPTTIDVNLSTEKRHRLGVAFWTNKTRSAFDIRVWKWKHGVFALCNPPKASFFKPNGSDKLYIPAWSRFVYYGVEFNKRQLLEFSRSVPALIKNSPKSRVESKIRWDGADVHKDIMDRIDRGGSLAVIYNSEIVTLDFSRRSKRGHLARLSGYIQKQLAGQDDEEPSPETAKRLAKPLIERWDARLAQQFDPS
jgi:hypothetical protein